MKRTVSVLAVLASAAVAQADYACLPLQSYGTENKAYVNICDAKKLNQTLAAKFNVKLNDDGCVGMTEIDLGANTVDSYVYAYYAQASSYLEEGTTLRECTEDEALGMAVEL